MRLVCRLCLLASACVIMLFGFTASGFELMFGLWPISVAVILNLVAAYTVVGPRLPQDDSHRLQYCTLPFIFPAAIILYAMLNQSVGGQSRPNAADPIPIVLALQGLLVLVLATITRGYRWLVLSVGLLALWTSCSVSFIGWMMVTGDWL